MNSNTAGILLIFLIATAILAPKPELFTLPEKEEENWPTTKDIIVENYIGQECPNCECTSSCTSETRQVQGCHINMFKNKKPEKEMQYTGMSNIPTIFQGNTLKYITITEEDILIPGCFYMYDNNGEKTVHRLIAEYASYAIFRGDNNQKTEKIPRKNITRLITGIEYT